MTYNLIFALGYTLAMSFCIAALATWTDKPFKCDRSDTKTLCQAIKEYQAQSMLPAYSLLIIAVSLITLTVITLLWN